jgi:hypothetical protein
MNRFESQSTKIAFGHRLQVAGRSLACEPDDENSCENTFFIVHCASSFQENLPSAGRSQDNSCNKCDNIDWPKGRVFFGER